MGVDKHALERALDTDDPKAAFIELLVLQASPGPSETSTPHFRARSTDASRAAEPSAPDIGSTPAQAQAGSAADASSTAAAGQQKWAMLSYQWDVQAQV